MTKHPEIQVVYDSYGKPVVQIQLTPPAAKAFLLGREKVVNQMVLRIEGALKLIQDKENGV